MKLCVVQSNLNQVQEREFEEHSKRCWQKGRHHFMARFTVKVFISPADLKFEVSNALLLQSLSPWTDGLFHSYGSKVNAAQEIILLSKSNGILLAWLRSLLKMMGVDGRLEGGMARCKTEHNWHRSLGGRA